MWKFCYYIHSRTCKQRTLWEQYTYKFSFCVHCREVVLFSEVQNVLKLLGLLFGTLKSVLCREVYYIISLSQRVHYWGFYCIHKHILHIVLTFSSDNCLLEEAPPFTCWVEVVAHPPLVSTGHSFRKITKTPEILCQSFKVWVFRFKVHIPVAIKRTNPVKQSNMNITNMNYAHYIHAYIHNISTQHQGIRHAHFRIHSGMWMM